MSFPLGSRPFPRSRGLALSITFAALISVSSPISIPIGPVPITLQVFIVYLALALLGPRWGGLSMVIYLFLGLAGLPVFAGLTGGEGVVFGSTGGYLLGFLVACLLGGLVTMRRASTKTGDTVRVAAGCLVGIAIIYALGVLWLSEFIGLNSAIVYGLVPFIPIDLLKAVVAVPLAVSLRWSTLQLPTNMQ